MGAVRRSPIARLSADIADPFDSNFESPNVERVRLSKMVERSPLSLPAKQLRCQLVDHRHSLHGRQQEARNCPQVQAFQLESFKSILLVGTFSWNFPTETSKSEVLRRVLRRVSKTCNSFSVGSSSKLFCSFLRIETLNIGKCLKRARKLPDRMRASSEV